MDGHECGDRGDPCPPMTTDGGTGAPPRLLAEPLAGRGRRAPPDRGAAGGTGLGLRDGEQLEVVSRDAPVATMVVLRDPGEVYLLRHTAGDGRDLVRRADRPRVARAARALARPPRRTDLARWTGRARERLALRRVRQPRPPARARHRPDRVAHAPPPPALQQLRRAARRPPRHQGLRRHAPAGRRTHRPTSRPSCSCSSPTGWRSSPALDLPERSIARLSALRRRRLRRGRHVPVPRPLGREPRSPLDDDFRPRYRTIEGQTYGWDAVLDAGAAWFLDNGEGSEGYAGTLRDHGRSPAPLHLVRVDLATAARRARRGLRAPERARRQPAGGRSRPAASWSGTTARNGVLAAFDVRGRRHARRPAGRATRTTRAIRSATPTPASSSPPTTTRARRRARRRARHRVRHRAGARGDRQPAPVGGVPRRGLRPRPLHGLVHDGQPRLRGLTTPVRARRAARARAHPSGRTRPSRRSAGPSRRRDRAPSATRAPRRTPRARRLGPRCAP